MPQPLQFMDCPHCGKRVRTNAERCHHCGQEPAIRMRRQSGRANRRQPDSAEDLESHHSAAWGGYDASQDDFSYEEFLEEEFGESKSKPPRPWWWYVAWVVLIVFVLGLLVDVFRLYLPAPAE